MAYIIAAFGNWRVLRYPERPGFVLVYCHMRDGFVLFEDVLETFPPGYAGQSAAVAALKRRGFN